MIISRHAWKAFMVFALIQTGCQAPTEPSPKARPEKKSVAIKKCNLATIYRIYGNKTVDIFKNPDRNSDVVRRLSEGDIVYTCSDYGSWVNVYFSGEEAPCFRTYEGGLEEKEAKKCSSGWVQEKWVNTLSG